MQQRSNIGQILPNFVAFVLPYLLIRLNNRLFFIRHWSKLDPSSFV